MKILCTRPTCPRPENFFTDLDDQTTLKTVQQKFCMTCGMPLILDGRYLPERLLGRGGFGAAFLASDRRSPMLRKCVVKQFQPAGDLSAKQLELAQNLFEREALVLDRLGDQHPQIPNLLAYFPLQAQEWQSTQPQQFFYLVQEYIEGQDLEAELATKGQFSETETLEVLQEILKVLKFVHDQEVIHRDIKPSNIMRHRNGRLYLLDFGAVKQITQGVGIGEKSTGIYSMGFAPPEQMRGQSVYPSTDLYALAVTCVTLLTGKDPQTLYDSYSDRWHWQQQTQVSENLATVLDRMLLPTPSDRFGSAEQVLEALNPPISVAPAPVSQTVNLAPQPAPSQLPAQSSAQPPVQSQSALTPPQPQPLPSSPVPVRRQFSTLEWLGGAAFTGFEVSLLIAGLWLKGVTALPLLGMVGLGAIAGLIFAQTQRWIERLDLGILAGISLGIALMFVSDFRSMPYLAIPIFTALLSVAATAIFRLVYILLSRLL
ncbi:MAG: protein kinase domain-containing protein [Microcoleaceae cyanobacterium]